MNLATKRRIAADVLKVGKDRVYFDPDRLPDIKEAITKADIRKLINEYAIQVKPVVSNSRSRIRKNKEQKKKGRRKGQGSRKGKMTARLSKKERWMAKIRPQRVFLKELKKKDLLDTSTYREVYKKAKSGFFRSVRHIKLYLVERELFKKKK